MANRVIIVEMVKYNYRAIGGLVVGNSNVAGGVGSEKFKVKC
jgi:hypothetical protein